MYVGPETSSHGGDVAERHLGDAVAEGPVRRSECVGWHRDPRGTRRAKRTIMGKWRSLPLSYRSPAAWPPIAACTVALMSPGERPRRAAWQRSMSMRIVGCPNGLSTARSVIPGTVAMPIFSRWPPCQGLQIVAEQLDGVLALDAGGRFLHVVLDVLREVEFDPGKLSPGRRSSGRSASPCPFPAATYRTASAARRTRR